MTRKGIAVAISVIVLWIFVLGFIGCTIAQEGTPTVQESLQSIDKSIQRTQEVLQSTDKTIQSTDKTIQRTQKAIQRTQEDIEISRIVDIDKNIILLVIKIDNVYKKILGAEDLKSELKRQKLDGGIGKDTLEKANKIMDELYKIHFDLENEGKFISEINRFKQGLGEDIQAEALQERKGQLLLRLEEMKGDIGFLKRAAYKAIIALHSL